MEARQPLKFAKGDKAIFKGSASSYYGYNPRADVFIGDVVTIVDTFDGGVPNAYLFGEFKGRFWFAEDCFDFPLPDLPEFEANTSLEGLF